MVYWRTLFIHKTLGTRFLTTVGKCFFSGNVDKVERTPDRVYKAKALLQIRKAIGNVLRVDTYTASKSRGRFARLCVQVSHLLWPC